MAALNVHSSLYLSFYLAFHADTISYYFFIGKVIEKEVNNERSKLVSCY